MDEEAKNQILESLREDPGTNPGEFAIFLILTEIHSELVAIRQATEQANAPSQDDEPDPYQTLNGP